MGALTGASPERAQIAGSGWQDYGENGIYEEKVKEVPYVFYYPSIPSQYVFLDSDGNELT